MSGGDADMTLAFSLDAAERLADPEAAFADARQWSRHLGIVSREPRGGERFARDRDLAQDFFTGTRGMAESLGLIQQQYATKRYVFVGTDEKAARLADSMDWEYLPIEDAADAAGWELTDPGWLDRVRRLVGRIG